MGSWLLGRSLGLTSLGGGPIGNHALGRLGAVSSTGLQRSLYTGFRHFWTVSGHMYNPAYCCQFDRTGRFVVSGADDYNLKIWP